jgi:hypothetical protein
MFMIYALQNFVNLFFCILNKFLGPIAHNVPAVYDVFATRIRACAARPVLQKCGGVLAWE